MSTLLIVGAGGHGRVIADTALRTGRWSAIAWVDDRLDRDSPVLGFPVLGTRQDLPALRARYPEAVVSIGDDRLRVTLTRELQEIGYTCPFVVAPTATVSTHCVLGPGTVVLAGATVSVDVRTGRACILNHGCTVDHDCVLGDGVHICPGANLAGNVEIGDRVWIGIGAAVIQGIKIGMDAVVGAGAAVIRDVASGATVGGVPAAPLGLVPAAGSRDNGDH